jgi:superfamily II DNA or RNA helicase
MSVELTESLLSQAAGWEVMKMARAYLAQGKVLSSYWAPPLLRGVVQNGDMTFRGSMVIRSGIDIENLCNCREAREWGKICAHSVGVALHWIQQQQGGPKVSDQPASRSVASVPPAKRAPGLRIDVAGEPTKLHLVLPPDVDQAIARGKLMLVCEAETNQGRRPLNTLPKERSYALDRQDTDLLSRLEELAGGATPALLQLPAAEFAKLLPLLVTHPRVTLGKSAAVAIKREPFVLPLKAVLETNGEILLQVKTPATPSKGNTSATSGFSRLGNWVWQNATFQPLGLPEWMTGILEGPMRVPRTQVPLFLSQHWPLLQQAGTLEANFSPDDFTLEPQAPKFHLELRGGLARLTALLQCGYGSRILTLGVSATDEAVWLPDPEVTTRYSTRELTAERAALARLQRSGFTGPDGQGQLQLLGQDAVLNFFAREFPRLERDWTVRLEERLETSTRQNIERIQPRLEITPSGVQWFDLGVVFTSTSGQTFSPAEIQRLVLSGQSHTRLRSGKLAVIDTGAVEEFQEVLRDCNPQQHGEGYRLHNRQAGFLQATLEQQSRWKVQAPAAWKERAARQAGETRLECPPLGDLETVLRPYQKQGVAWLHFLRQNGFGGILADEMGLGKTLQALAYIRQVRQADPTAPPILVVCPTSLVFNWVEEAHKFTPTLKVLALQGPERHLKFAELREQDLVVTSYALIRRDAEKYGEFDFDTVILDEAQHIKNRQTQNAQAVKAVRSRSRLVLTGTPLENSVLDLWSIFDFLMPGYLGSAQDFRERYEQPITRARDAATQARLARRLRPFLLRRLKRDVATDLPERLEQVSYCELTEDQRAVYQQLLEATRKEVLEASTPQQQAKSRMVVLSALLRLRQACCDLRLLKAEGVDPASASGKLDMFGELLEEVIDGGHRVLVFSQFVSMLTLLRERLQAEGLEYCYLDGSTTNRREVVERFQRSGDIPVFLISLKAGGVGLNLTGADTVIHFDPWWNPAVEDQATDRAHRIGQTRVVTSYKLICRDTVEEKILALQNRKREIIKATIAGEDEFAASLTWEEVQELLA